MIEAGARIYLGYMRRSLTLVFVGLALIGMSSFSSLAQPVLADSAGKDNEYVLNSGRSRISFSIGHFFVSSTQGQFISFDGRLGFEPQAPEHGFVTVHVYPGSVTTDSAARDEHLRTADFFNVDKFPSATFQSKTLVKDTSTTGRLVGTLSLHGVTKPVTLKVTLLSPDPNGDKVDFSATGALKRSDYGMNNFMGVIGDEVSLDIQAEFDRKR